MTDALERGIPPEAGRCTATLIRILGDIDLAEDAVAEAFTIAAQQWPRTGIPPNPGGWITTTARNRAIDRHRRESTRHEKHLAAHRLHIDAMEPDHNPELDGLDDFVDVVADDQLRLMFLCAHPALSADAQVALILRLLGGLATGEIAKAFLVPEPTMAQRIVRAKRKLHDNHASYRIPRDEDLPDRLSAVLAAIYLIYTEGHTATSGPTLSRTDLSAEAIRLGRTLVELMPDEPEAIGLLALMLLTQSRRRARTAADGAMVRLADQDRTRWDRALISEGHDLVRLPAPQSARPGPDPSIHRGRPRRRFNRRVDGLVSDHRPLRPTLCSSPQSRCRPEPGGGSSANSTVPFRGWPLSPRSTRCRFRVTSPTTRPEPTCSPASADTKKQEPNTSGPSN